MLIKIASGVIIAFLCAILRKKIMIVLTSFVGAILVVFYSGFLFGVLEDIRIIFKLIFYDNKFVI